MQSMFVSLIFNVVVSVDVVVVVVVVDVSSVENKVVCPVSSSKSIKKYVFQKQPKVNLDAVLR
jgi:hypothetical protein